MVLIGRRLRAACNMTNLAGTRACTHVPPPLREYMLAKDQLLLSRAEPFTASPGVGGSQLKLVLSFHPRDTRQEEIKAVWKPLRKVANGTQFWEKGDWPLSEVLAYALDRHLGLFVVPPTMWMNTSLQHLNTLAGPGARLAINSTSEEQCFTSCLVHQTHGKARCPPSECFPLDEHIAGSLSLWLEVVRTSEYDHGRRSFMPAKWRDNPHIHVEEETLSDVRRVSTNEPL